MQIQKPLPKYGAKNNFGKLLFNDLEYIEYLNEILILHKFLWAFKNFHFNLFFC